MTEEIIIFEQDGNIVGITKEGKYFESYKTTENVAILRGAGLYIKRLEQENKKLKKDVQLFKCLDTFGENECHCACRCLGNEFCEDADKKINTYRSALEEIKEKIKSLNKDICNNCGWHNTDNCQPNGYVCHDLIEIKNKINEVLK